MSYTSRAHMLSPSYFHYMMRRSGLRLSVSVSFLLLFLYGRGCFYVGLWSGWCLYLCLSSMLVRLFVALSLSALRIFFVGYLCLCLDLLCMLPLFVLVSVLFVGYLRWGFGSIFVSAIDFAGFVFVCATDFVGYLCWRFCLCLCCGSLLATCVGALLRIWVGVSFIV